MNYKVGDELVLKIEEDFGYKDKTIRNVKVLVIGFDLDCDGPDAEYMCYVPQYERIKDSFILGKNHQRVYNFHQKYIGDEGVIITINTSISKHIVSPTGENCYNCNNFIEGAEKINDVYACKACKDNPWR